MSPVYQFTCSWCKAIQEVEAPMTENVESPFCDMDGNVMIKVFSSPGVIFNATGFYSNGG